MAEIVLRIRDKPGVANPHHSFGAGDVVAARPDLWPWTAKDLANPDRVLVKLPGVAVSALWDTLVPATVTTSITAAKGFKHEQKVLLKRARGIDLTNPVVKQFLDAHVDRVVTVPASRVAHFLAAKRIKPVPKQVTLG